VHRERLVARVQWARGGDEHARTSCVAPAEDVPDISCAPNAFECGRSPFGEQRCPRELRVSCTRQDGLVDWANTASGRGNGFGGPADRGSARAPGGLFAVGAAGSHTARLWGRGPTSASGPPREKAAGLVLDNGTFCETLL